MLNYSKFLEQKIYDIINESVVYFSPKLRNQLNNMDDDISKELLGVEKTDIKPDLTFVDVDKEGYLSFTTMKNADKLIKLKNPNIDFAESGNSDQADRIWEIDMDDDFDARFNIYKKSRNQIKIGKFINTLLPKKYTSSEIEQFVNKFKSNQENNKEAISIVEGETIEYWYDSDRYFRESGTLGSSCMRKSSGIFNIYTQNPGICRLLIITEDNKLKARAIIWKVSDQKFEYFLDRQYTVFDSDVEKMRNYAVEQGWAFKTNNNHHSLSEVTFEGNSTYLDMTVQVNDVDYERYPYMDTFRTYDPNSGILYNCGEDEKADHIGEYILDDTSGGYTEIEDEPEGEWSQHLEEIVPPEYAVWSDRLSDWLDNRSANEVTRGSYRNRGWYPEDSEDVCYSDRDGEWYHMDDSMYSEYYADYIYSDDAVNTVMSIEEDGDCDSDGDYLEDDDDDVIPYSDLKGLIWFEKVQEIGRYWDYHSAVYRDLLVKNYEGSWVPKVFEMVVYREIDSNGEIIDGAFLTRIDSYILKRKIFKDKKLIMDKFEYHELMEDEYDEIKLAAKVIIDNTQLEFDFNDVDKDKIEARKARVEKRLEEIEELE